MILQSLEKPLTSFSLIPHAPRMCVRLSIFVDDFFVDLFGSGELHDWARANLPDGSGLL
jgi:hypothetical protein